MTHRFDPTELDEARVHHLMVDAIVPRPIAWITTLNEDGSHNLAPFSYFAGVCAEPPLCVFAAASRERAGRLEKKDTLLNAERTGELVIHVVQERSLAAMNQSSAEYPYGTDELALSGLDVLPAERVRGARIVEAPIAMECAIERIIPIGDPATALVVCRILLFHVADGVWVEGRIDFDRLDAVGRLGTSTYARTHDRVVLRRPR